VAEPTDQAGQQQHNFERCSNNQIELDGLFYPTARFSVEPIQQHDRPLDQNEPDTSMQENLQPPRQRLFPYMDGLETPPSMQIDASTPGPGNSQEVDQQGERGSGQFAQNGPGIAMHKDVAEDDHQRTFREVGGLPPMYESRGGSSSNFEPFMGISRDTDNFDLHDRIRSLELDLNDLNAEDDDGKADRPDNGMVLKSSGIKKELRFAEAVRRNSSTRGNLNERLGAVSPMLVSAVPSPFQLGSGTSAGFNWTSSGGSMPAISPGRSLMNSAFSPSFLVSPGIMGSPSALMSPMTRLNAGTLVGSFPTPLAQNPYNEGSE